MFIDSINNNGNDYMFGGTNTIIICSDNADERNKTATTELPFEIHNDLSFKIKFTLGSNSDDDATLNINSTGGKPIVFTGSEILKPNVVYDCYFNGESYVINNSCYELEGKTWRETALNGLYITTNTESITTSSTSYTFNISSPVGDVALSVGSVVKITFRYALRTSYAGGITSVNLNYGGRSGPIVAQNSTNANGYANIKSHVFSSTFVPTYNRIVWDAYTTLELMWIGNAWLVMGNPVLCSYFSTTQSYTVYANGLIEQWGLLSSTGGDVPQYIRYLVTFTQPPIVNTDIRRSDTAGVFWYSLNLNEITTEQCKVSSHSEFNDTLKFCWDAKGY